MPKCNICDRETDLDLEGDTCDRCWYGMRMDPNGWKKEMVKEGIEIERGMGCVPTESGFICGDPYRKKVDDGI